MDEQENKPGSIKVPAKSKHQVKVIVAENADSLEKMTNEFLGTITDEKRLTSSELILFDLIYKYIKTWRTFFLKRI